MLVEQICTSEKEQSDNQLHSREEDVIYLRSSSSSRRLGVRLADEKFLVCGSGSVCLAALKLVLTHLNE